MKSSDVAMAVGISSLMGAGVAVAALDSRLEILRPEIRETQRAALNNAALTLGCLGTGGIAAAALLQVAEVAADATVRSIQQKQEEDEALNKE